MTFSDDRRREIGDDSARDAIRDRFRPGCQIAQYATAVFTQAAPPCGRPSSAWTDDLGPTTTYMCKRCAEELAGDFVNVHSWDEP